MNIEVGKKYKNKWNSGDDVVVPIYIGSLEIVVESDMSKRLIVYTVESFNQFYKEYVEPKKTKKIEVADYLHGNGEITTYHLGRATAHWNLKKVIGSERTIDVEE